MRRSDCGKTSIYERARDKRQKCDLLWGHMIFGPGRVGLAVIGVSLWVPSEPCDWVGTL